MPGFFFSSYFICRIFLFSCSKLSPKPVNLIRLNKSSHITLVGAGNVSWHLGHRLIEVGCRIVKLINRENKGSTALASDLNCQLFSDFSVSNADSDFVIVAINDSFIGEVLQKLDKKNSIILHTSGSLGMEIFPKGTKRFGVLYPFQTLTSGVRVNFSEIPLCIEGCDNETRVKIEGLAKRLSSVVHHIDSQQRQILHLTGVIANNFTNHFMTLATELLQKHGMDKNLLMPLFSETLAKLKKTSPIVAQTGPARRNNKEIIEKHLALLNNEPGLKKLYSIVSDSIIAYYSG